MSGGLRARLRLVFGTEPTGSDDGAATSTPPPAAPWIELVAFTEDCRVSGRIQLDSDRLSDTLNGHPDYLLCDVLVESLADGRSLHADEVPIDRDELLAVLADGPRGDPARRTHTLTYPVTVTVGPYVIRGNLHSLPGVEPLAAARRRRPMIPLSDAWIEYRSGDAPRVSSCGTILVNRETADSIELDFPPPSADPSADARAAAVTREFAPARGSAPGAPLPPVPARGSPTDRRPDRPGASARVPRGRARRPSRRLARR
ncbi:MAG: hypothetical protein ACP5VP_00980 [Candidatus Limnocylindrales bacterium]